MKKIFLLFALLFLINQGCKKEEFVDDFSSVEQTINKVTFETPQELTGWLNEKIGRDEFRPGMFQELFQRSAKPLCYDSIDLLSFLSQYGQKADDYIPAWNNYFQDANCNVAQWQYFGYERDPETSNGIGTELVPDSVVWSVSGAEHTTYGEESLFFQTYTLDPETLDTVPNTDCPGIFQPPCNGGHATTVTVYLDEAVYQRSAVGWAQVNTVPETIAPFCAPYGFAYSEPSATFDWAECGCLFEFNEFEFMIDSGLDWDLAQDGHINTSDLLILLTNYGC